jgi:hypothetical protein
MSTVGAVIARLYRTVLYPPDAQPALAFASNALTAVTTDNQLTISAFAIPEDEQMLRIGTLLEVSQELMRVTDYDAATRTVTVLRAAEETTIGAHEVNDKIIFDPTYPRGDVFQAVADNITTLHPKLYTTDVDTVTLVAGGVGPIADPLAVSVISIWDDSRMDDREYTGRIVDYHPGIGGRALIVQNGFGTVWCRYKRRMDTPTAETEALADLGVDERWANLIRIGAAADLLVGRDVSQVQFDWISQVMEAEVVRPGTRTSIAVNLARYRDVLMERFQQEMDVEYRPSVRIRDWAGDR